jgi:hypothetical protein
VALLAGAWVPVRAAAQGPASGSRVAVVLFLSYQAAGTPPSDLGSIRGECWDRLASGVHDLGHDEIPRSEIEPSMRRWQVRTDLSVSGAFLDDVATQWNAGVLLICNLTIYEDRVLYCGRSVETATGDISWADIQEQRLPLESGSGGDSLGSRWSEPAAVAARRLLGSWDARTSPDRLSGKLFVVPVRPVGMEPMAGRLIQSCLLRSLVGSHWRIEEPGLTFSRLREAGMDPRRLDPGSRPALAATGAHGVVLVCDLLACGEPRNSNPAPFSEGEGPVRSEPTLPPSMLSIRLLDIESGVVLFASTEYLETQPSFGLFGKLKDTSPVRRVQPVADRLVRAATRKG